MIYKNGIYYSSVQLDTTVTNIETAIAPIIISIIVSFPSTLLSYLGK